MKKMTEAQFKIVKNMQAGNVDPRKFAKSANEKVEVIVEAYNAPNYQAYLKAEKDTLYGDTFGDLFKNFGL